MDYYFTTLCNADCGKKCILGLALSNDIKPNRMFLFGCPFMGAFKTNIQTVLKVRNFRLTGMAWVF